MNSYSPIDSLHPDCPDWRRMGPTTLDAGIRAMAETQAVRDDGRTQAWSKGFTRRKLLAGGMGAGVAAIGSQLVTTRVAYAAGAATGTLVVVFLRGGMDGLSMVAPTGTAAAVAELVAKRGDIALRGDSPGAMGLDRGFVLSPALAALKPYVGGRLAAVPAVSTPSLSRSHFQAQDCLERGGASGGGSSDGWLDRLLQVLGTGTTFRSIGAGSSAPRSLLGQGSPVMMDSLAGFGIEGIGDGTTPQTMTALRKLYTGIDHPMSATALTALLAADTVSTVAATEKAPKDRGYEDTEWGNALGALGSLIRTGQGVRVATIDLGGWDMHTAIGTPISGDFNSLASKFAQGLATFLTDLGPAIDTTTVVVMTEFGRRVEANASGGVDHGHGGVALILGGGVAPGVKGAWDQQWYTSQDYLDSGDIPGTNDFRNLLSEVVMKRFGLTAAQISPVFPDWTPTSLGVMV